MTLKNRVLGLFPLMAIVASTFIMQMSLNLHYPHRVRYFNARYSVITEQEH